MARAVKAAGGLQAGGGALRTLRRTQFRAAVAALTTALPISSAMCWSALTTTTDRATQKAVLFWDATLFTWEYPQVVVTTLSMAILFFYIVWVCGAIFRAGVLHFNSGPPVAVTLACWQAATRAAGLLRSVSVVLSQRPQNSMGLLVTISLCELAAAAAFFDRVPRAMESDTGELLPPPPVVPPAWAVGPQWGVLNPHLGVALGEARNRFRTWSHAHLWMVLGAFFLNVCTGAHYQQTGEDPSGRAATGWGVVLILVNAAPVMVLGASLAQSAGPHFCKMFPSAAEAAAARLAGGNDFAVSNPLAVTSAPRAEDEYDDSCWFQCCDGDGEMWYENFRSGETSWELPPSARLVPAPTSPFLPPS